MSLAAVELDTSLTFWYCFSAGSGTDLHLQVLIFSVLFAVTGRSRASNGSPASVMKTRDSAKKNMSILVSRELSFVKCIPSASLEDVEESVLRNQRNGVNERCEGKRL